MRFDWSSCAVGVTAGVGAVLCVIFAAQLDIILVSQVCAGDENGLTCARAWVEAIAIVAAAATIALLVRDQRFARRNRAEDRALQLELATYSTLKVRSRIAQIAELARRLERRNGTITTFIYFEESEENPGPNPSRRAFYAVRRLHQMLGYKIWNEIYEIDGSFQRDIRSIRSTIETFLMVHEAKDRGGFDFLGGASIKGNIGDDLAQDDALLNDVNSKVRNISIKCSELTMASERNRLRDYFRFRDVFADDPEWLGD